MTRLRIERAGARAILIRLAVNLLFLFLLTAAVSILLHRLFLPGFPVYRDNPPHLASAVSYIKSIQQGGSFLDGWSMSHCGGYPLLLYYPKTGFWWIAAAYFFFGLSAILSYKLLLLLSILLPVLGVFVLLRRDTIALAAFFGAFLFLMQNNLIHYALSGMWSNALATGVLFLFGAALFGFTEKPTYKRAIAAGLLLGLLTLTHLYIMIGGLILWGSVFVTLLVSSDANRRVRSLLLLAVPPIGFLVSYLYIYPFAKASGWLTPATGDLPLLSAGTVLGNLFWKGDFFSHGKGAVVAIQTLGNAAIILGVLFALLGILYAFDGQKKEKAFRARAASMLLFVGLSSLVASGIIVPGVGLKGEWLRHFAFFRSTKIHGYRFLVLARAGMVYFAAYGLTRLIQDKSLPAIAGLGKVSLAGKFRWPVLVPLCASALLAANLPYFFYDRSLDEIRHNPFFPARDSALLTTSSALPTAAHFGQVCDWLRQNGDLGNRRVFFQNTLGNARLRWRDISAADDERRSLTVVTCEDTTTHFTHLPAIGAMLTAMPQIGSWIGGSLFPIEKISLSESGMFFGSHVEEFDDAELVLTKRYLQRLNISHIVTCEHRFRSSLSASRFFTHKATFGEFDIFEVPDALYVAHKPGWAYFGMPAHQIPNNRVEVQRFSDRRIEVSFENYATLMNLRLAVCHHPFWKASVDGKSVRVRSDDIGLMRIPLETRDEKGRLRSLIGKHKLRLEYVPDRGNSVPISIGALIVCIILLLMPSRTASPLPQSGTADTVP